MQIFAIRVNMRLDEFLTSNRLTLHEFAREIGVDAATVHRIKEGRVAPHRKTLERIHQATGGAVTPNDILGLHPPSTPTTKEDTIGPE